MEPTFAVPHAKTDKSKTENTLENGDQPSETIPQDSGGFALPALPKRKGPTQKAEPTDNRHDNTTEPSPAPISRDQVPPVDYEAPEWSAAPKEDVYFEVLRRAFTKRSRNFTAKTSRC